jgi:hypothetical protein
MFEEVNENGPYPTCSACGWFENERVASQLLRVSYMIAMPMLRKTFSVAHRRRQQWESSAFGPEKTSTCGSIGFGPRQRHMRH